VTAFGVDDEALTGAHGRFLRRLHYRGCEYVAVNDWKRRRRHLHLAVLAPPTFNRREVGRLWRDSLPPGVKGTHYAERIRDLAGLARYLSKNVKAGGELVSRTFHGRIYTASQGFLVRPLKQLWREQIEQWFGPRRASSRADSAARNVEKRAVPGRTGAAHETGYGSEEGGRHPMKNAKASGEARMVDTQTLELHPWAECFPEMTPEECAVLKRDIQDHGLREPLLLAEGKVAHGRHRLRAARELGIAQVPVKDWDGQGSLVERLLALNLYRRHMSSSQKAALAVDLKPRLKAEACERKCSGKRSEKVPQIFGEGSPDRHAGEAAELLARLTGTNRQYVSDADRLKKEALDLFEKVRRGEMTIPEAKRAHQERIQNEAAEAKLRLDGIEDLQAIVEAGTLSVLMAAPVAGLPESEQQDVVERIKGGSDPAEAMDAVVAERPKLAPPQKMSTCPVEVSGAEADDDRLTEIEETRPQALPIDPGARVTTGPDSYTPAAPVPAPAPALAGDEPSRGEAAGPPADPPVARDDLSIPVQPYAEEAFGAREKFDELIKLLKNAKKLYGELADLEGGAYLRRPGVSVNARGGYKHHGIENAIKNLEDCRPSITVCPRAYQAQAFPDSPHEHTEDCVLCHGLNWSRRLKKGEVSEQLLNAAKKAFGAG
jgi:ParB-like chromosome segregation protein Spo0J